MNVILEDQIESFREDRRNCGFVLDFDGTLSSIVPTAEQATLVPGGAWVLEQLVMEYGLVAIVSGRRAQDVWGKIQVPGLRYVGLYGAEEWTGTALVQPEQAPAWRNAAEVLAEGARNFIADEEFSGCEVEKKDIAVSLHFRNAIDPAAGEALLEWARAGAGDIGFVASLGRKVIDVRPAGISKAAAFEKIVHDHRLTRAVMAGDDAPDVEAMRRAGELMGPRVLRIGVRSKEEPEGLAAESELLVESCEELVALLRMFI